MRTEKNFKQRTLQPRVFLIIAIFAFSTQFVRPLVPQLSDWWFVLLWIVLCIVAVIVFGITVTRVVVAQAVVYDQTDTIVRSIVFGALPILIYQNPTITSTWLFALLWTLACLLLTFLIDRIPRLPKSWRDKGLPIMLIFPGTAFFVRSLVPFMHPLPFLFGWVTLGAYISFHISLLLTRRRPRW
ncbi:hypothetical protein EFT87_02425 [Schleiferilactobacillus harbinensis]|uniref:hypothetical protein n=1 Tax=Schleiferilactobacillus harbinensis TaxID=304207 RepID=UPI0021A6FB1C|nr:hypothetical protein [Schleiferilactobacillus harbinensis]MCT2907520.1 hypothetical protein [Schleiferilactobacillus harbinensis]